MSDLFTHDDEGVDENGPNDIDYLRMLPGQRNDDFTIGGPVDLQQRIRKILHDYEDIFSFNVKGKAMSVPPMKFTVDAVGGKLRLTACLLVIFLWKNMPRLIR